MLKLYKFYQNCYRQGFLEGLFIEHSEYVDKHIKANTEVYLDEVLGKHSDVSVKLNSTNIIEYSNNEELVALLIEADNIKYPHVHGDDAFFDYTI